MFSRTKDPNKPVKLEEAPWTSVDLSDRKYLNITSEARLRMEYSEDHKRRNELWNSVLNELWERRNFLSEKPPMLRHELPKENKDNEEKEEL